MQIDHQMLVAVLAVMLTTANVSITDTSTASLPAVVNRGEDECPALRGAKIMDKIRQNVFALLQEVVCYNYLVNPGPVQSLQSKHQTVPQKTTAWILNSTDSSVQVLCGMSEVFPANLTVTKGWIRGASLNMTDPNQQCPSNFHKP